MVTNEKWKLFQTGVLAGVVGAFGFSVSLFVSAGGKQSESEGSAAACKGMFVVKLGRVHNYSVQATRDLCAESLTSCGH